MEQKAVKVAGLSSKLQTMKFMQRDSKNKVDENKAKTLVKQEEYWKIQYSEEELKKIGVEATKQKKKFKIISTQSFMNIKQNADVAEATLTQPESSRTNGRKSYQKFNPAIEKIEQEDKIQADEELKTQELKKNKQSEVEMSKFYSRKKSRR
ncbi:hypothetical protein BB561_002658 [Smittium simulii]|uniref:Uncharacterized protein n=1 Tax=Smittium simulii TaxID=133385 RepID=A0A2T9YPM1_9FUNG|nr:hypothetical protein BB561_002658 [Smittium simulii]